MSEKGRFEVLSTQMIKAALLKMGFRLTVHLHRDIKLGVWSNHLQARSRIRKEEKKRIVFIPGFGDSLISWTAVLSALIPVFKSEGFHELCVLEYPGFTGFLEHETPFDSMTSLRNASAQNALSAYVLSRSSPVAAYPKLTAARYRPVLNPSLSE